MDDQETISGLVATLFEAIEGHSKTTALDPAHIIAAAVSVAVSITYTTAKDPSEVREMIGVMVDDFAGQAELQWGTA